MSVQTFPEEKTYLPCRINYPKWRFHELSREWETPLAPVISYVWHEPLETCMDFYIICGMGVSLILRLHLKKDP